VHRKCALADYRVIWEKAHKLFHYLLIREFREVGTSLQLARSTAGTCSVVCLYFPCHLGDSKPSTKFLQRAHRTLTWVYSITNHREPTVRCTLCGEMEANGIAVTQIQWPLGLRWHHSSFLSFLFQLPVGQI
jgi:hypothetical protein